MKIVVLLAITLINLFMSLNLSQGDRYVANLNKWYTLALDGKWQQAENIEKHIDPVDIKWFKDKNKSENLKKRLNELTIKTDKSADDWMTVAQIQSTLSNKAESRKAIEMAHKVDPIRADIEKVYFSSL